MCCVHLNKENALVIVELFAEKTCGKVGISNSVLVEQLIEKNRELVANRREIEMKQYKVKPGGHPTKDDDTERNLATYHIDKCSYKLDMRNKILR